MAGDVVVLGFRAGRVFRSDAIPAAIRIQVQATRDADRIATRPAPQPRRVIPRVMIAQAALLIPLLPRKPIPLLGETPVTRLTVWRKLLAANQCTIRIYHDIA